VCDVEEIRFGQQGFLQLSKRAKSFSCHAIFIELRTAGTYLGHVNGVNHFRSVKFPPQPGFSEVF
jgi:hypothetical protein